MDTLKDIWASLVAGVRDRTTNPLTLSFILSWSLWNYKFFVILFEDTGSAERLNAIAAMYPHEGATYLGEALLYPLASALVYVFVYPVVSMLPIGVYRKYQVWTANLVKRVEKSRVLTQAEATELTRRHEREKTTMEKEMVSHAEELTQLRNALKDAEEQISKLKASSPIEKPNAEPGKAQGLNLPSPAPDPNFALPTTASPIANLRATIAKNLSQYTGPISLDALASNLRVNPLIVKSELHAMVKESLARDEPHRGWSLTSDGEKLALDLLLNSETVANRLK